MIFVAPLAVAIVISAWIPLMVSGIFPEILQNKAINAEFFSIPSLYLLIVTLFIALNFSVKEFRFMQESFQKNKNTCQKEIVVILLFFLWSSRILFYFYNSQSIYINISEFRPSLVSYLYIEICFRLYPLVIALIACWSSRSLGTLILLFEILYGISIFSKFIIMIAAFAFLLISGGSIFRGTIVVRCIKLVSTLFSVFLLFAVAHRLFGYLRVGSVDWNAGFDLLSVIGGVISRFQSISSIYYASDILDRFLVGESFCMFFGFTIPDWILELPLQCRNVDENVKLFSSGSISNYEISLDLFGLWGEPFINFGVFGIFVIGLYAVVASRLIVYLGTNDFGLVLYYVFAINTLLTHQSLSLSVRNIVVSFFILVILKRVRERNSNGKTEVVRYQ